MEKRTTTERGNFFQTKLFYVLISILASVCLWLYVVGVENPEREKPVNEIPINFVGEDFMMSEHDLMLMDSNVSNVTITFRAKNSVLSKLSKSTVSVSVDVSSVTSTGVHQLLYNIVYPEDVDLTDVTVVSMTPQYVRVVTDKLNKKTIPIEVELNGNVADGYKAEEYVCDPETIVISGPEEEISQIDHALVVVNRSDVSKTISDSYDYVLIDNSGNEYSSENISSDTDKVGVTLPIVVVKTVMLTVNYIDGGGATESNVVKTVEPETIMLSGDENVLEQINQINLGTIDLSQVLSSSSQSFNIAIPNGVENLSGITEATVQTEIVGLSSETFTCDNIEVYNVTEGFEAVNVTKKLDVLVRAPELIIDLLTENNIRIVADLSDLDKATGNYTVPATVYIDGYSEAGAVGKYYVVVMVDEESLDEEENENEKDAEAAETSRF